MAKSKKRIRSPAFVIESRGGVLYDEFTDVAPTEFKVKSRRERQLEQDDAWADFDRELREKLRKNKFGTDPETNEVKKNDKA